MSNKLSVSLDKAIEVQKQVNAQKLSWAAQQAYASRIEYVRKARENLRTKQFAMGMHFFHSYLNALAMYYQVDVSDLKPELLKWNNTEQYEFIVVTFVYWELAKIYDKFPDDIGQTKYCLRQMCSFAKGHRIQRVMSSALSVYVRKKKCKHLSVFEEFDALIKTGPVECYIATYCYGEGDERLEAYRSLRGVILNYSWGLFFVEKYYKYSPKLVSFCRNHQRIAYPIKVFMTFVLNLFFRFIKNAHIR